MNNRQRVFDALLQQPGSPLTPHQLVQVIASKSSGPIAPMSLDAVTAALKWLVANGKVEKHRRRRDFGYTVIATATRPIDLRTRDARNGKAA
jgi:Fe2+ or Zn2+ uptake regulation protein